MKVLVKIIAGSHLFGLNTENSDKDFKGVYAPSASDILLGTYSDVIQDKTNNSGNRNSKVDTDIELYSLRKFFKMVELGDTSALELLFCPDSHIIESSPEWDMIRFQKKHLISKNIKSLIGYVRHQISKYGVKSSRLGELELIKNFLKEKEKEVFVGAKLFHVFDEVKEFQKGMEFVNLITLEINSEKSIEGLEILGKKYDINTPLSNLTKKLSDDWKSYGQRAREARKNEGLDYKAISHSVRCCIQGIEMLSEGKITIPHVGLNRDLLLDIKTGKYSFKQLEEISDRYLKQLESSVLVSSLPSQPNMEMIKSLIENIHLNQVLEEYDPTLR